MGAHDIEPKESIPASRKLGADDAAELAGAASTVIVSKGKKVSTFKTKGGDMEEIVAAMLGPTGNLRAPTLRVGKTIIVGFNEDEYSAVLAV